MKTINFFSLLLIFLGSSLQINAQRNDVMLTNSQSLDDNLYEGVEGSPFYFKTWQKGTIYPITDNEPVQEVLLNFNGYTRNFEIKKENRYIALDEKYYDKVAINNKKKSLVFETGLLPKRKAQFVKVVYQGTDFHVLQDFHVSLVTREQKRYAGDIEIQEFVKRPTYHFVENGKSKLLKLKKKNILGLFPTHQSSLGNYAKQHRLKLNSENDLVTLLTYYEELTKPNEYSSTGQERE